MFTKKTKNNSGKVVVIDGTSTSGKTSITHELVNLLDESYEKVAIDDFVIDVIMEQKKLQLPQEQFLERIWQASDKMFDKIEKLALNGKNVLVDTVLSGIEGEKELLHGLTRLKNLNIVLILVYCPLNILAKRVHARNELAIKENNLENIRSLVGVVRFTDMYRKQKLENEVIVGQISRQEIEIAYTAPLNAMHEEVVVYNENKKLLIKHFELINKNSVNITPNIKYDFIVDSSKNSPKVCAENIYMNLSLFDNVLLKQNCAEIVTIDSISQVFTEFDFLDEQTLVAFDLDDTLINANSGMFYLLYRNLEDFDDSHKDFILKLRQNFNQLDPEINKAEYYNIFASAVFAKTDFIPTENITIETIKKLQDKKIKVIGLTTSNTGKYGFVENMQKWREATLNKVGLDFSKSFDIQEIEFDNLKKVFNYYPAYYKGVLSAARNPKGKVLLEFFKKINWQPKKLIFVDDSYGNCIEVEQEMQKIGITVKCFCYKAAYLNKIKINEDIIKKQVDYWLKFNEFISEE